MLTLALVLAVFCIAYLLYVIFRPEKF